MSTSDQLDFAFREIPGPPHVIVATLSGTLDARTVADFQKVVDQYHADGVSRFVLVLDSDLYINSTGLGVLVRIANTMDANGGGIALVNVTSRVQVVFDMLGLQAFFRTYPTEEEGVAALREATRRITEAWSEKNARSASSDERDVEADPERKRDSSDPDKGAAGGPAGEGAGSGGSHRGAARGGGPGGASAPSNVAATPTPEQAPAPVDPEGETVDGAMLDEVAASPASSATGFHFEPPKPGRMREEIKRATTVVGRKEKKRGRKKEARSPRRQLDSSSTTLDAMDTLDAFLVLDKAGKLGSPESPGAAPPPEAQPLGEATRKKLAAAEEEETLEVQQVAAGDTLERRTTVRYYQQMNPMRNFPLLVLLTKEVVERIVMKNVEQSEGAGIAVRAANPIIEIVPRFPGCLVVPDRLSVDVRPDNVEAQFFVTPLAPGNVQHARVEVWYEGRCIDTIDTPTRVTTQFAARVMALGGVINPLVFGTLEGLGVNPQPANSDALLVTAAAMFGGSYLMLGLAAAAVCATIGAGFWMLNRPRKSDPVVQFMNWKAAEAGANQPAE